MLFPDFAQHRHKTSGAEINFLTAGKGPPLLFLHGYPQNLAIWHHLAPRFAREFTVVTADLRGYGDSSKPATTPDHFPYSKRAMAQDMVEVMQHLGHEQFVVVGHDRGARTAHRMALDHAGRVRKLAVLDIVPTLKAFSSINQKTATQSYHWFFLSQPYDLPEHLIGSDPEYYLRKNLFGWTNGFAGFHPDALASYIRCYKDPATLHGMCEDYRAAATIDLEHDRADLDRKVTCPVLALWGERAALNSNYDVVAAWRERANDVRGGTVPSGHYLPEEAPDETYAALRAFLVA